MTDFSVHLGANAQGQEAFLQQTRNLISQCDTMAKNQWLATWSNTHGANIEFETFKQTWNANGANIAEGLRLVAEVLGDINDIAWACDGMAAKAWGSGWGV